MIVISGTRKSNRREIKRIILFMFLLLSNVCEFRWAFHFDKSINENKWNKYIDFDMQLVGYKSFSNNKQNLFMRIEWIRLWMSS